MEQVFQRQSRPQLTWPPIASMRTGGSHHAPEINIRTGLFQLDWELVDELHHIPIGRKGSPQEVLRTEYAAYRAIHRSIGANLPAQAAFDQAVFNIHREAPGFQPRSDSHFVAGD